MKSNGAELLVIFAGLSLAGVGLLIAAVGVPLALFIAGLFVAALGASSLVSDRKRA